MITTVRGFLDARLKRSIDTSGLFYMMVRWDSQDNHRVDFPASLGAARAMPLLRPLFAAWLAADHVLMVDQPAHHENVNAD